MSLPCGYSNTDAYFTAAVEFLHEYAWIYEHANTRCLQAGVFERMPADIVDFFTHATNEQLNTLPLLQRELELPPALHTFRKRLQKLTPTTGASAAVNCTESATERELAKNLRKVSAKKRHEILKLSQLIVDVLDATDERHLLLDFGAGLGYLSETLYRRFDGELLLLGVESEAARVATAQQRQRTYLPEANGRIAYQQLFIDTQAQATLEAAAQRLATAHHAHHTPSDAPPTEPNMTIVGLHACADLSVTAMQLFLRMPRVRNLIIMPCCYHKLQLQSEHELSSNAFVHFPLSVSLRRAAPAPSAAAIFQRPFLRLACQETSARWAELTAAQHATHGRAMFWRAVAEALAATTNVDVDTECMPTVQRHGKATADDFATFDEFRERYELRSPVDGAALPWQPRHEYAFNALQQRYGHGTGAALAEGLTCLQTAMQQLCENLVLYDRYRYLVEQQRVQEANVRLSVRYEKVLNEKLSPRCYALIAQKLRAD